MTHGRTKKSISVRHLIVVFFASTYSGKSNIVFYCNNAGRSEQIVPWRSWLRSQYSESSSCHGGRRHGILPPTADSRLGQEQDRSF